MTKPPTFQQPGVMALCVVRLAFFAIITSYHPACITDYFIQYKYHHRAFAASPNIDMAVQHINEFPPEILAHVFEFSDCEVRNHSRLLQLASVCSHWRNVLTANPGFWTHLECSIPTKLKNGPHLEVPNLVQNLERWFNRAGDMPRSLTLSFNAAARKTALLYEFLIGTHQWKFLCFTLNITGATNWSWLEGLIEAAENSYKEKNGYVCWPRLETLEIEAPGARYTTGRLQLPLEFIAPNLRQLKITVTALDTTVLTIFNNFPWSLLTHFELTGSVGGESLRFYFHLLEQAPNLECLKVLDNQHIFCPTSPLPHTIQIPLTHSNLRHLALHDSPNTMLLLKCLRLPSLFSLDLSRPSYPGHIARPAPSTPVTDSIRTLMLTSHCEIKSLRLKWTPLFEEDLYGVMATLPSVELVELDEAACFWTTPAAFFSRMQELESPQDLLPKLRRFSYNRGYRCRLVEEGEDAFEQFKRYPLDWWIAAGGNSPEAEDDLSDRSYASMGSPPHSDDGDGDGDHNDEDDD